MRDNHDPVLARLFAEQASSLSADGFITQLVLRVEREQQKHRFLLVVLVVSLLAAAALLMPWVMQVSAAIGSLATDFSEAFGSLLHSPLAWLVAGALAIGMLPVVYVWRAWRV